MLKNLSYFEFQDHDGNYVSRFPSGKTSVGSIPTDIRLFPDFERNGDHIFDHLKTLSENSFSFTDIYWFLKPSTEYNWYDIVSWMHSLYYKSEFVSTPTHIKCVIMSTIDPNFNLVCYRTSTSLPQEAIDSIPICKVDNDFRVVLGRRASNPPVIVNFPTTKISIQTKPGYVLYGEHLLPEKKKQIEELYTSFLECGRSSMQLTEQNASEALRAIYEEGGLIFDGNVKAYMLPKDSEPGRDLRYWLYGSSQQYGYKRVSMSYNVLLLIPTIDTLPEPIDTNECQKGIIVSEKTARKEFCIGGSLEPVFPCHSRQLINALNIVKTL